MTSNLSSISVDKSRRDSTLLTVGFNLRTRTTLYSSPSPAGTALGEGDFVSSPAGLWREDVQSDPAVKTAG